MKADSISAMKISYQQSLVHLNTFSVPAIASKIYYPKSVTDLESLADQISKDFYILGEGSNTLFTEQHAPELICPTFNGKTVTEIKDSYLIEVGAGENWHQLVVSCIENGQAGLENLALIPGSVGAAPVQNIGAYGVEFADFCQFVTWFDLKTKQLHRYSKQECQFGYRDSIFKRDLKGRAIITSVTLSLPKHWQPKLSYAGLDQLSQTATSKEVMAKVIEVRQSKLPDPKQIPNAGSFFKNPVVAYKLFEQLNKVYPNLPSYPVANSFDGIKQVKLAAGWLIDQAKLKGKMFNGVGVHDKQALVLINPEHKPGKEIVKLAGYIQAQVYKKFSILLEPEVRFVSDKGETNLAAYKVQADIFEKGIE